MTESATSNTTPSVTELRVLVELRVPIRLSADAIGALQRDAGNMLHRALVRAWEVEIGIPSSPIPDGSDFTSVDANQLGKLRAALKEAVTAADVLLSCRPERESDPLDVELASWRARRGGGAAVLGDVRFPQAAAVSAPQSHSDEPGVPGVRTVARRLLGAHMAGEDLTPHLLALEDACGLAQQEGS